ncbi:hypothetical protein [Sphingomonas qomolangmaensis]|uniref:Uncharacterized protein n=1 Tax=Sphingomonas qomolangmaensis TaxID=2918765 RepID=A0ABY5LA44_9SPHN|nr:hypothetical protein [Sphingomonas qomolangmaensis]UUL83302.1 hypothetical protein NMP03_03455 [Sphingomonas qomolangmaensis]
MVVSGMSESSEMDLRSLPDAEKMRLYQGAASCAVQTDAGKVKRYLDAVLTGQLATRDWNAFRPIYQRCLELTRQVEGFVLPGTGRYLWLAAVNAEAYLRANPPAPIEPEPIASLYQDAAFQNLPTSDTKTVRCLVRTNPAKSLAVIATEAGSAAEDKAIAALVPAIGQCTDSGATVSIKRAMLRLNIAPAYYAMAVQQAENPAAEKN